MNTVIPPQANGLSPAKIASKSNLPASQPQSKELTPAETAIKQLFINMDPYLLQQLRAAHEEVIRLENKWLVFPGTRYQAKIDVGLAEDRFSKGISASFENLMDTQQREIIAFGYRLNEYLQDNAYGWRQDELAKTQDQPLTTLSECINAIVQEKAGVYPMISAYADPNSWSNKKTPYKQLEHTINPILPFNRKRFREHLAKGFDRQQL